MDVINKKYVKFAVRIVSAVATAAFIFMQAGPVCVLAGPVKDYPGNLRVRQAVGSASGENIKSDLVAVDASATGFADRYDSPLHMPGFTLFHYKTPKKREDIHIRVMGDSTDFCLNNSTQIATYKYNRDGSSIKVAIPGPCQEAIDFLKKYLKKIGKEDAKLHAGDISSESLITISNDKECASTIIISPSKDGEFSIFIEEFDFNEKLGPDSGQRKEIFSTASAAAKAVGEDFTHEAQKLYVDAGYFFGPEAMRNVFNKFYSEMVKGLAGKSSSLAMLPAYVDVPTGNEIGWYLALDLGGTNFRSLKVELKGNGAMSKKPVMKEFKIKKELIEADAGQFFDFIADCIAGFLKENQISAANQINLGFTFSFPVVQTAIDAGTLLRWTKGFAVREVKGRDVVKLLNEAFERKNIYNVKIAALCNDTVGTMLARAYEDPACDIGVIFGTGTNACYREKIANISKLPDSGAGYMVINTEWGNFDKFHKMMRNKYDIQLDKESENPGEQILEKMVSGKYLGELARLTINDFVCLENREFFKDMDLSGFGRKGDFRTSDMSRIEDDSSSDLKDVGAVLSKLGIRNSTLEDRKFIREICGIISTRAARISAAVLAATVTKMDTELNRPHTVAVDGTLYEKYPRFAERIEEALKELLGLEAASRINMVYTTDGSGKGAAVIAAVASAESARATGFADTYPSFERVSGFTLFEYQTETGGNIHIRVMGDSTDFNLKSYTQIAAYRENPDSSAAKVDIPGPCQEVIDYLKEKLGEDTNLFAKEEMVGLKSTSYLVRSSLDRDIGIQSENGGISVFEEEGEELFSAVAKGAGSPVQSAYTVKDVIKKAFLLGTQGNYEKALRIINDKALRDEQEEQLEEDETLNETVLVDYLDSTWLEIKKTIAADAQTYVEYGRGEINLPELRIYRILNNQEDLNSAEINLSRNLMVDIEEIGRDFKEIALESLDDEFVWLDKAGINSKQVFSYCQKMGDLFLWTLLFKVNIKKDSINFEQILSEVKRIENTIPAGAALVIDANENRRGAIVANLANGPFGIKFKDIIAVATQEEALAKIQKKGDSVSIIYVVNNTEGELTNSELITITQALPVSSIEEPSKTIATVEQDL